MSSVRFTWQETYPARAVAIRLIGYDSDEKPLALALKDGGTWEGEFELPGDLRTSYQICPVRDTDDPGWASVMAAGIPDPHAVESIGPCTFGNSQLSSILELPDAPPQPWFRRREGVPRGTVDSFDTGREWPSAIHVYRPPDQSEDLPLVILLDGQAWMPLDVTATFDNLIADGMVPAFLSAIIGYPFGPTRVRGLTDPGIHLSYLLDELLPWLTDRFGATTDPAHTVLIGQSLGGLAAVNAGLQAPHRFGNILAQSSSLWWSDGPLTGDAVISLIEEKPVASTRFWLEAGALETGLVPGNRRLRDALATKGYPLEYREYQGGHDFACWRGGLADGLIALRTHW